MDKQSFKNINKISKKSLMTETLQNKKIVSVPNKSITKAKLNKEKSCKNQNLQRTYRFVFILIFE
jgi:hypothetical protein